MKLSEKKLQDLKDKKISIEDLNERYFYTSKDGVNIDNILKLLNENICSFQEIVDKYVSIFSKYVDPFGFSKLLGNRELFEELNESNKLNTEDTRYLLNTIDHWSKLDYLCENTSLIKYILNEFILDKDLVDRFNKIIENDRWYKRVNTHTIFDMIEYHNKDEYYNRYSEEILKLNELIRKVYMLNNFNLSKDQKLEIHEILRNNEIAKNTLIQIIDSHLEDQYNFESLKNLLTKNNEKKKTKLNF